MALSKAAEESTESQRYLLLYSIVSAIYIGMPLRRRCKQRDPNQPDRKDSIYLPFFSRSLFDDRRTLDIRKIGMFTKKIQRRQIISSWFHTTFYNADGNNIDIAIFFKSIIYLLTYLLCVSWYVSYHLRS